MPTQNIQHPGHSNILKLMKNVCISFCEARSKNIPVNGPMLLAEANKIALKYNYDKFTASNRWLQRFST